MLIIASESDIKKLKAVGIYQIVGGVIGILLTLGSMGDLFKSPIIALMILIGIVLYVYSITCGVQLLNQSRSGLNSSLINQFLQLVNFTIGGVAFKYVAGVYLFVGIDLTHSNLFSFSFGYPSLEMSLNASKDYFISNINFVASLLIIFLDRQIRRINADSKK